MRTILTLALKDLRLQSRDLFGMFWIMLFPLMLALFFGSIFSSGGNGGRRISLAVIDDVKTDGSGAFLKALDKSPALNVEPMTAADAQEAVLKGKKVAYLIIKSGFQEEGLLGLGQPRGMELGIDPSRRADTEVIKGLIMEAVFSDFKDLLANPAGIRRQVERTREQIEKDPNIQPAVKFSLQTFFGQLEQFVQNMPPAPAGSTGGNFNLIDLDVKDTTAQKNGPRNAFEITFPSSILWAMIGCLTAFAISLVIERREGTFLRLRTAPLTFGQLLAGKGLACFLSCGGVTLALLGFATLFLGVQLGNLAFLALAIVSASICFTGIMMFVSTLGKTEQSVAGAGWGIMMPMAMLGGGMIPLIAMPSWMLTASHFSPVKWGILAIEGAIWRQFTLLEMLLPCGILLAVGAISFGVGVLWLRRQEQAPG